MLKRETCRNWLVILPFALLKSHYDQSSIFVKADCISHLGRQWIFVCVSGSSHYGEDKSKNLIIIFFALILYILLFLGALGIQARRSSISATCQAAERCMGRHLTCELISGGILGSDHLCAPGYCVASASHAVMSCSDTNGHTQVSASI